MLFDHIDMRVRGLANVRPLLDPLLSAMGYSEFNIDDGSIGYHQPGEDGTRPFLWVIENTQHAPGLSRIAFAAATRSDVDRLASIAQAAGARAFEAPHIASEYGPFYYAAFFEDAEGNKYEICCRKRS